MAATLTTKFYKHYIAGVQDPAEWGDPSRIVFTSPNMDDGVPTGTRSHVLPDLMDIALWYEGASYMFRKTINQNEPSSVIFGLYGELHSSFDFDGGNTTMTLYDQTGASGDWPNASKVYYNNSNYFAYTNRGWNPNNVVLGGGTDTGTLTAVSGTNIFLDPSLAEVNFENSIVYEMTLGEAYNVYLTAWDDDTHSSTDNTVISGSHYRATGAACYITGDTSTPYPAGDSTYGTLIGTPAEDQVLNGDTSKWTITDPLRYNAIDSGVSGAYVFFRPRLYNITSAIPPGIYDFITTLHFQYT